MPASTTRVGLIQALAFWRDFVARPGPGKCVHCLREFQVRNWDHVFPKSWYPDSTPPNLEKWKIPTCEKCNAEYGKIEEELLVKLAMTVDPNAQASLGIYDRALRSVDESTARDERDRSARRVRKESILEGLIHGEDIPKDGIYPNLGERWEREIKDQVALLIPANYINRLCEKIVRGITYIEDGTFIEPPFVVEFYALEDQRRGPIGEMLERHGKIHARGPGIEVVRVVPADEQRAALFKITIFGEFQMYAVVSRPEG